MVTSLNNILETNLNGLSLKSPIMTASGTYGYADEYNDFFDVSELGAIITKAISLNPRKGNENLRIIETEAGMINSIGLENVGFERFISEKLPILKEKNINFVVNIAGATVEEYKELAKLSEQYKLEAIELNVSCPNVKSGCLEFGSSAESLYSLVSEVRSKYNGFIIVKLTPNVTSIEDIAIASEKAGANAVSAINTVKGLAIKFEHKNGKFSKSSVQGGYSGIGIKPIALSMVNRIHKVVNIPIIAIGGIYKLEDLFEFFAVGAEAIQIGTANFTYPDIAFRLQNELEKFIIDNGYNSLDELKKELRNCYNGQ